MPSVSSFYGNMKNNSRSSFIIDKVYPNRAAMEDALIQRDENQDLVIGDGIFVNRYVLVDYSYTLDVLKDNQLNQDPALYEEVLNKKTVTFQNYNGYYYWDTQNNTYKQLTHDIYSSGVNNNNIKFYQRKININKFDNGWNFIKCTQTYELDNATQFFTYNTNTGEYEPIDRSQVNNNNKTNYWVGEQTNSDGYIIENDIYYKHKMQDYNRYHAYYDKTVWMKIYIDNQERYIMVAELNAKAPLFNMIPDAPSCTHGMPHIDMRQSRDGEYWYYTPANWDFKLNNFSPTATYNISTQKEDYYLYEQDKTAANRTYDYQHEYPFIFKDGLDKIVQKKYDTNNKPDEIAFKPTLSGKEYPVHTFRHTQLTKDTYFANRFYVLKNPTANKTQKTSGTFNIDLAYYTKSGNTYTYVPLRVKEEGTADSPRVYEPINYSSSTTYYYDNVNNLNLFTLSSTATFSTTAVYYDLTWKFNEQGAKATTAQYDIQRIDINFPTFGNTFSDIYDLLYGIPTQYATNEYFFRYASSTQYDIYKTQTNPIPNEPEYQYWTTGKDPIFYLKEEDADKLSPILIPGVYDIPIFVDVPRRPYSDQQIRSSVVEPYKVGTENEASVGWSITAMARYLSELRQLASGGQGLQSDWILEDSEGFGYIHNRPALIYSYEKVTADDSYSSIYTYFIRNEENNEHGHYYTFTQLDDTVARNNFATYVSQGTLCRRPAIHDNGEAYKTTSYSLITKQKDTENYVGDYYSQNAQGSYEVAYKVNSTSRVISVDPNIDGGITLMAYQIKKDNNNNIVQRNYNLVFADNANKVYLWDQAQDRPLKRFWVSITSTNTDANLLLENANTPAFTAGQIFEFLNQCTLNNDLTPINTYYDIDLTSITENNAAITYSQANFYYGQLDENIINKIKITSDYINGTGSYENEGTHYNIYFKKIKIPGKIDDYEIHNIWQKAIETPSKVK